MLRAEHKRLWSRSVLLELDCGWNAGRVTFPIRDDRGALRGVLRYAPRHDRAPKMLAVPGTRLGPLPHPAADTSERLMLVEGPPDMITARSQGLPAIAVPGDDAWQPAWAQLFTGRVVVVAMDCDSPGRAAAARIVSDLDDAGVAVTNLDVAPEREDGYDLTDFLAARHGAVDALMQACLGPVAGSRDL
jgi:DNA primase